MATSVSGFLFRGNLGNPASGFTDSAGQRFDRFGSDDSTIEGLFDVAGLEIPNGASSAQYQLTVEPIDPTWFATGWTLRALASAALWHRANPLS